MPEVPDLIAKLEKFDWRSVVTDNIPVAPQVSPWLQRTRWHEKIKAGDIPELIRFAGPPTTNEEDLEQLQDDVLAYFRKATDLMPITSELELQKLNSGDPDKDGINNTPLHEHQHRDKTLRNYAQVNTAFLASLLRPAGAFSYPMTPSLTAALGNIRRDGLHPVFRALWMTTWHRTPDCHMPDPTMCFLMLRSIKHSGEFKGPSETTQPIQHLCWAIKLACLTEVHDLVRRGECDSQVEAIDSLKHYAFAITNNTSSLPNIWWTDRENWSELMFKGNPISLSQLTTTFGNMEAKLVDMWENNVLLGLGLRAEYGQLSEDLGNTEPGYSFLDDPRNPFGDQEHRLLKAIYDNPELRARFFTRDGLNGRECRKWAGGFAEFEKGLMLKSDMGAGAPPRGVELVNGLVRNTRYRTRNLAGLGSYVALIRQYNKTTHQRGDTLIPHALDAFTADLVIQMHVLARPFARLIAHHCMPDKPDAVILYSNLLFVGMGKPFTTDDISHTMVRETIDVLGWSMTVSIWRHINIAFRRKHLGEVDVEDSVADHNAQQSGHSRRTENQLYGLSQHALAGVPEDLLFPFMEVSIAYQKLVRIVPGGLGLKYRDATADRFTVHVPPKPSQQQTQQLGSTVDLSGLESRLALSTPRALTKQSTEQTAVLLRLEKFLGSNRVVAAEEPPPPSAYSNATTRVGTPVCTEIVALQQDETPPGSTADRTLVQITAPSASVPPGVSLKVMMPRARREPPSSQETIIDLTLDDSDDDDFDLFEPPSDAALLDVLRQLEGPHAQWKTPQQYEAVRAVADWQGDVMIASATGSGKTMAAVIPALLDPGYTVIVLPLIALMEDWERRLTEKKVHYERFLGRRQPHLQGRAKIILVSNDIRKQSTWTEAIASHYYYTDKSLRPEPFANPETIRIGESQVVAMSASLHPAARNFVEQEFMLTNTRVITGSSDRPELNLVIEYLTNISAMITRTQQVLEHIQRPGQWRPEDRILIFVNSHAHGLMISEILGVPYYHANSADHPITDEARREMYKKWAKGQEPIMVCSTALAAGNDHPNVRVTFHIGAPYDFVLFDQQRGRAGRDGREAWNVILAQKMPSHIPRTEDIDPKYGDLKGRQFMYDLVYGDRRVCVTLLMTRFMEGTGRSCADLGRPLCYRCDPANGKYLSVLTIYALSLTCCINFLNSVARGSPGQQSGGGTTGTEACGHQKRQVPVFPQFMHCGSHVP
ncbi:hypothetical protein GGX14DRAFT_382102 [Mycena pura]|uniref:DNA 3'-5' helicase n=1 Tax=Mycena pura TaxID=153505 RepID=A0AAD6UM42_9AGAR|nr:hypothetical protein GGX14DRAFT_382102 [Mycena pura]